MPFYFALPRSGFTSVQGRQETGRTDYVRTAPTSLTFTTHVPIGRIQISLLHNLHAVAMSAMAGEKGNDYTKTFRPDVPSRLLYPSMNPNHVIRISLPKMSFRFRELSETQENRLIELNMEERNVKGKGRVWVGQLNSHNAVEVAEFGTVQDYASMGGTVSVRGIAAITAILRIISIGAQTLTLANSTHDPVTSTCVIEYVTAATTLVGHEHRCSDMVEVNTENLAKGVAAKNGGCLFSILARQPLGRISGSAQDMPGIVSNGVFCPFEPNYSQTDRRAIHVLLSDFASLCTDAESFENFDHNLVEMWTKEICLTMEGEFIAHMIACLSLAKKIGSRVYFLITGTLYEGAILHGSAELSFKLVGGRTYKSIDQKALEEDITKYAFHSTTLNDIIREVVGEGEVPLASSIKSMRQLRNIVMGRLGQSITPQMEASIGRQLLFLNFRERQESVNPTTLAKFISYVHPSAPVAIPETVYLDRRAFFSKDTTVIALSMFGIYAPSPIISGQTMILAAPPGSNKTVSKEPNSVQFAKKELLVAARDWDGFTRGGSIVQPSNKIKRGIKFSGAEKTEIWGILTGFAGAGIAAKKSEANASKKDRESDKRQRDEDGDSGSGQKAPFVMAAIDFSMFGGMNE
jgi:hypothetical protein